MEVTGMLRTSIDDDPSVESCGVVGLVLSSISWANGFVSYVFFSNNGQICFTVNFIIQLL